MEKQSYLKEWIFQTGTNVESIPLMLTNINDDNVSAIGQVINNQSSLFVLLRHFAWLPWRQHIKQIEDNKVLQRNIFKS